MLRPRGNWRTPWRKPWGYPLQDWTPAQIFAGGDKGFYADPIAGLYVFSDTAGTTHAPLAGTVARLDAPPGSPVAASFTNATVSQQPVRRADGLEFDGVDDALLFAAASALAFGDASFTTAFSISVDSFADARTIIDVRDSDSTDVWSINTEIDSRLRVVLRGNTVTTTCYFSRPGGWPAGIFTDIVVENDMAANSRAWFDNVLAAEQKNISALPPITGTMQAAIGGIVSPLGAKSFDGTIGRIFAIDRLLTPAERANLNAWLKEPHS